MTVLGSAAAGVPGPGNAGTGFLLEASDTKILLDAGNGVLGNLARFSPIGDLAAIVITHAHADHVQDLYPIALFLKFGPRKKLPLYGPPGLRTLLYRWFHLFTNEPDPYVERFEIHEFEPWEVHEIGSLRVQACPVEHGKGPAFAIRATATGAGRFCFSGDSKVSALLTEAAKDADLFICEATFPTDHPAAPTSEHLTWDQAGSTARDAGAKQLVLTHLRLGDDVDAAVKAASAEFGAPVAWAAPLAKFLVEST